MGQNHRDSTAAAAAAATGKDSALGEDWADSTSRQQAGYVTLEKADGCHFGNSLGNKPCFGIVGCVLCFYVASRACFAGGEN